MPIPAENVQSVWHLVSKWVHLAAAADPAALNADKIALDCMKSVKTLWIAWNAETKEPVGCFVSETVIGYDNTLILRTILIAGDETLSWADHCMGDVIRWAREHNVKRVQGWMRPGFERVLSQYHFRKTHVFLDLDLERVE